MIANRHQYIAMYSQDEIVTCINGGIMQVVLCGGIMQDLHTLFCSYIFQIMLLECLNIKMIYIYSYYACVLLLS